MRFETLRKIIEKPLISLLVEENAIRCRKRRKSRKKMEVDKRLRWGWRVMTNLGVADGQWKGSLPQVIFNYAHNVSKVKSGLD